MSDTVYFTFGRMNPPTRGHEKLIDTMVLEAAKNKAMHLIILSRKCNYYTDPLDFWTRYRYLKMVEATANIHPSSVDRPDFFSWLKFLYEADDKTYKNLVLVSGTDRAKGWLDLANKYNGASTPNYYKFDKISMIEVPRDENISSTLMRGYARNDDFKDFKELAPKKIAKLYLKEMFEDVKSGLQV